MCSEAGHLNVHCEHVLNKCTCMTERHDAGVLLDGK